jgi:hypothetical protein
MKKIVLAAIAAVAMVGAMAANAADIGAGASVGVGAAGFAVVSGATSAVTGTYNTSLSGIGSQSSSYTAGNQSFGDAGVSFGSHEGATYTQTTQYNNTGNGNNGVTDTQGVDRVSSVGFDVSNESGSENFGNSISSSLGLIGNQNSSTTSAGAGTSLTGAVGGLIGVSGAGFAGF